MQAHDHPTECSWQKNSARSIERHRCSYRPSIQEWLPEHHLARFVVDIVEQLDLSEITSGYGGSGGKRAYHPAMLVALLFYGYATGVFSSRKLEQATYDSVAFRYITGDEHPDHDTIASFRKRFLDELQGLFKQILVLAAALGTLRMGRVSLDGTKVQGNASKHKAMSWGHANKLEQQLEGEVQTLLELAQRADQEGEQEQQELDIPEELQRRQERLAAIREAKEKIKERAQERHEGQREEYEAKLKRRQEREAETGKKPGGKPPKEPEAGPKEKDQVNFTDEESRIMPGANGEFIQGYNAQAVVEQDSHMVVGNHVSQAANDKQEVAPALNELGKVADELGKPEGRWWRMPGTTAKRTWIGAWNRTSSRISRGAGNATTGGWKIVSPHPRSVLLMRMR